MLCAAALPEPPAPAPTLEQAFSKASKAVKAMGAPERPPMRTMSSWSGGSFESTAGGAISYRSRPGTGGGVPTVFLGGWALADSFESYFAAPGEPQGDQYYVVMRGHPPSGWSPTQDVMSADALDLARMILTAARQSGSPAVNLVLHSYATMVFQRMLQLRGDFEVGWALDLLQGGKVVMLNATTHYGDSENVLGWGAVAAGRTLREFIAWLDAGDAWAEALRESARLNPLLAPGVAVQLADWSVQRRTALATWTYQISSMQQQQLSEPWPSEQEPVRQRLLEQFRDVSSDPGWQEALLRRAAAVTELEFTRDDVAAMRSLGLRVDIVYAAGDSVIPWRSERTLTELLDVPTSGETPAPGTVLQGPEGLVRVIVVEGDHYLPLKDPAAVEEALNRP